MDALDRVTAYKDTSYFLMLAAAERGHEVFYLEARDLLLRHDQVHATLSRVAVHADVDKPFTPLERGVRNLGDMDVVWIRTDPPVDRRYLYTTLLLDFLPPSTRVINRPAAIRDWNEKLAALSYPSLTPRTLVSCKRTEIETFVAGHDRVLLKPIDGHGGVGIVFVDRDDAQVAARIDEITCQGSHWVLVQEYLPAARDGDKRILLLDGEPLGAVLRLHADDQELNNLDAGATALQSELTERDREICAALRPGLIERGIVFAGIDIIGGMLMEINVTSPTVLQEMSRFTGEALHHRIVASLE